MNIAMPLPAAGVIVLSLSFSILADEPQLKTRPPLPTTGYRVARGQRIPVKFVNTVRAWEGSRVLLETTFPVTALNHIVIPPHSFIDAEITVARCTKSRAELRVLLGQLTLPGGVQRPFRGDPEGSHPSGFIVAAFTKSGSDAMVVPGTTADIVVVNDILFRAEEIETQRH
jgi:hypothetical protein